MATDTNLPTLSATGKTASSAAATGKTNTNTNTNTGKSTATATASGSGNTQTVTSASNLPSIGASTATSASSDTSITQVLSGAPALSSGDSNPFLSLSGLPTLSGAFSYPPASVPPTSNAPYMSTSRLPQNFVFIVVGGVLAFILLIVVMWRFLTAWSVNRAFKKDSAAMYTPLPDYKKKPLKSESGLDMSDLSNAKLPKSFNSVPNLFFSPTAEAARHSMIRPQSQHLPGGHYRDASK